MPLSPPSETSQALSFGDSGDCTRAERLRDTFELLSPADLSALIGVDERTLTVWRVQRRGPDFVKLGRAVFYRRADVTDWIGLNVSPTDRAA
jgi:hypothetical protein